MIRIVISLLAGAIFATAQPVSAQQPRSYAPLAECAWENAPISSAFWVNMDSPEATSSIDDPEVLLGLRLIALCSSRGVEPDKTTHRPNWRRFTIAMRSAAPRDVVGDETSIPTTRYCRDYSINGEERSLLRADVVRDEGDDEIVTYREYYVQSNAGGITDRFGRQVSFGSTAAGNFAVPPRVPMGLSVSIPEGTNVVRECQIIREDGSLLDETDEENG